MSYPNPLTPRFYRRIQGSPSKATLRLMSLGAFYIDVNIAWRNPRRMTADNFRRKYWRDLIGQVDFSLPSFRQFCLVKLSRHITPNSIRHVIKNKLVKDGYPWSSLQQWRFPMFREVSCTDASKDTWRLRRSLNLL